MPDNGIKFFSSQGYKLPDEIENEIEKYLDDPKDLPRPVGRDVGVPTQLEGAAEDYIRYLLSTVNGLAPVSSMGQALKGISIVLDCANGATSHVAPSVFESLGTNVHTIYNKPDGLNINDGCGSTHMGPLSQYVKQNGMALGLAFDGDGDRMLAVDENGREIDGDEILAICGLDLKERGLLKGNAIVATSMSNQGLEVMCNQNGITLHRTDVGDRYVLAKMLADDLNLGGEQSGHVIFSDKATSGDGVLTGLMLLSVVVRKQKPLSELCKVMDVYPQVLVNVQVRGDRKHDWDKSPVITGAIAEADKKLNGQGRILVRPSGTEALVRVMIEGKDKDVIQAMADEIAGVIGETLA